MSDHPQEAQDAPQHLRYLKTLVTVLTITMILGLIVIIGLFITRFSAAPSLALPDRITLPDGTAAEAFTMTDRWYAVVATDGHILVFDRASGTLLQDIEILTD